MKFVNRMANLISVGLMFFFFFFFPLPSNWANCNHLDLCHQEFVSVGRLFTEIISHMSQPRRCGLYRAVVILGMASKRGIDNCMLQPNNVE